MFAVGGRGSESVGTFQGNIKGLHTLEDSGRFLTKFIVGYTISLLFICKPLLIKRILGTKQVR